MLGRLLCQTRGKPGLCPGSYNLHCWKGSIIRTPPLAPRIPNSTWEFGENNMAVNIVWYGIFHQWLEILSKWSKPRNSSNNTAFYVFLIVWVLMAQMLKLRLHANLHFPLNPMVCQLLLYISPIRRYAVTKLKFLMFYIYSDDLTLFQNYWKGPPCL